MLLSKKTFFDKNLYAQRAGFCYMRVRYSGAPLRNEKKGRTTKIGCLLFSPIFHLHYSFDTILSVGIGNLSISRKIDSGNQCMTHKLDY